MFTITLPPTLVSNVKIWDAFSTVWVFPEGAYVLWAKRAKPSGDKYHRLPFIWSLLFWVPFTSPCLSFPPTRDQRCKVFRNQEEHVHLSVEEECVTMLARRPCPALSSEAGGSRSPPFLVGTSVIVDTSHYISGPWVSFFSLKWREVRPLPQVLLISKTTQEAVVRGVVDNLTVKHVAAMPLPVRRALSVRIPRRTLEELPFYLSLGNEIVTYCCSSGSVFCLFKPY